jgi:hypothetical protein
VKALLAIAALVLGFNAYAQESTTKAKKEEIMKEQRQNAPVQEDIDNEITNAKMRADSGSKSKHSLSLSGTYNGGSAEDAFGKTRPNIGENSTVEQKTSLAGDLSYRYRMSPTDSLTAGFGLKWVTPSYEGQKTEASNPGVGYAKTFKAGKVQNSFAASLTKITASELVDRSKMAYIADLSQTGLVEIGTSGWQVGLNLDLEYFNYTQNLNGGQAEYEVGVYPFLEYAFNDRYNFRTVFRGNTYDSYREQNASFIQNEPTQSLGVGIAATRDIFLYPNVQWVWRDTRWDKTNVALSASMNFF